MKAVIKHPAHAKVIHKAKKHIDTSTQRLTTNLDELKVTLERHGKLIDSIIADPHTAGIVPPLRG